MPGGRGAQLDQVHRLARVHVHVETHAIGHRDRVRTDAGEIGLLYLIVQLGAALHHTFPIVRSTDLGHRIGHQVAVKRRQRLPFEREHAVSLQITERPVVTEDIETVGCPFERAARFVAAVGALADVGLQHTGPLFRRKFLRQFLELGVRESRGSVERRGDDLGLAVRVELGQRDLFDRPRLDASGHLGSDCGSRIARFGQVPGPAIATVRQIDAPQECWDDRA